MENLVQIGKGALGSLTLGAYHQYATYKDIELNNKKIEMQQQYFSNKMNALHKEHKIEINKRINALGNSNNIQTTL